MWRVISVLFLCAITCAARAATTQPAQPVGAGEAGKWAFDELASAYGRADGLSALITQTGARLRDANSANRQKTAQRVLALFQQSLADESNGRVDWKRLTYFGGGAESAAREFRKALAQEFARSNNGEETITPARWLIEQDPLAENQIAGLSALRRIDSPRMIDVFRDLISPPANNVNVVTGIIAEAGRRGMKDLSGPISALCNDYRSPIREAAIRQGEVLGFAAPGEFQPASAFTPWLQNELRDMAAMVMTEIPIDATWKHFTITRDDGHGEPPRVWETSGWLLVTNADNYRVLDYFGAETTLSKSNTKMVDRTWAEEAADLVGIRMSSRDDAMRPALDRLSPRGGVTRQFEAPFISLPEALVAAWAYAREDRASAAKIIFSRYSDAADQRWVRREVRDMIGFRYHDELLHAFTTDRDYTSALRFARHLSSPLFDDYQYQPRAREMVEQLTSRQSEDFKALTLPTAPQWLQIQATVSRTQQIDYLARRLKLLNCFQWGQPGGVSYTDEQTEKSVRFTDDGRPRGDAPINVINPYVELRRLKLQVADLPPLVPYLADRDFMLVYSYWRDFHPGRTLHRVNWAVASIVNDAAKHALATPAALEDLDDAGIKQLLDQTKGWIEQNRDKTRTQLLIDSLSHATEFREFSAAAGELIDDKETTALPVLLNRMKDFPRQREDMIQMCYRLAPDQVVADARQWVREDDPSIKLWASLILLHSGDRNSLEGLEPLRSVLRMDKSGEDYFPQAFDELLAVKQEVASKLACEILMIAPPFPGELRFTRGQMVRRLLLAGRQEAFDCLVRQLDDTGIATSYSATIDGKAVQLQLLVGDETARDLDDWRSDGYTYNINVSDEDRAAERAKVRKWLAEQFELIRQGKPSAIQPDPQPLRQAQWQIDAP